MKKLLCLSLIIITYFPVWGQLTSLHENFDTRCATNGLVPTPTTYPNWLPINMSTPASNLGWQCNSQDGRNGTGCVACSNFYSSVDHIDTAYLITPHLDISSYTGNVYFIFDTKTTIWNRGSRLDLSFKFDSAFVPIDSAVNTYVAMAAPTPAFSVADSSGWVTHVVDITNLKGMPFFISFRYIGTTVLGSTWYIDNVNVSDTPAAIGHLSKSMLNLQVSKVGQSLFGSYFSNITGDYQVYLYNLDGKCIKHEVVQAIQGNNTFKLNDLSLASGLYCLRLSNGETDATIKIVLD